MLEGTSLVAYGYMLSAFWVIDSAVLSFYYHILSELANRYGQSRGKWATKWVFRVQRKLAVWRVLCSLYKDSCWFALIVAIVSNLS